MTQLEFKQYLFDLCFVVTSTGIRMLDVVTDMCRCKARQSMT